MSQVVYQQAPPRRVSLLSQVIRGIVGFAVFVLGSLCFSIVLEWLGMVFVWPELGTQHAKIIWQHESRYFEQQILPALLALPWVQNLIDMQQQLTTWIQTQIQVTPNTFAIAGLNDVLSQQHIHRLVQFIQAAQYIVLIVLMRTSILLLCSPLFVIALVVGAVDGLVARELRRWGGGRESSTRFKIAKHFIVPAYLGCWVVYLSWPGQVQHTWVVIPFAVLTAYAMRNTLFRMKKYF